MGRGSLGRPLRRRRQTGPVGGAPGTALKMRSGSHPPSTAAPGSPESRPLRGRRRPSARSHFRAGPPGADRRGRNPKVPKVPTGLRREKNSSLCNGTGSWPPGLLGLLLRPSKAFTSGRIALQEQPGNSLRNNPGGVVARFHLAPPPTSVNRIKPVLPARLVHAESVKLYTAETDL